MILRIVLEADNPSILPYWCLPPLLSLSSHMVLDGLITYTPAPLPRSLFLHMISSARPHVLASLFNVVPLLDFVHPLLTSLHTGTRMPVAPRCLSFPMLCFPRSFWRIHTGHLLHLHFYKSLFCTFQGRSSVRTPSYPQAHRTTPHPLPHYLYFFISSIFASLAVSDIMLHAPRCIVLTDPASVLWTFFALFFEYIC